MEFEITIKITTIWEKMFGRFFPQASKLRKSKFSWMEMVISNYLPSKDLGIIIQLSHEESPALLYMKSWLFDTDPYNNDFL